MMRSSVVLPLPDEPKMAVNEPSGTVDVDATQDRLATERLRQPDDRRVPSQGHHCARSWTHGGTMAGPPVAVRDGRRSNQRPST